MKKKAKPVVASTVNQSIFPLKISRDGRYLTNRFGQPFLMNADAGWTLFHKLKLEEVRYYLDTRRDQHFNTVFLQLLPPEPNQTNAYGDAPFVQQGNFATPDEKYFAYVEQVIKLASQKQLLVAIVPAWSGCCGTNWFAVQTTNGADKCRNFGLYLGHRLGNYTNVIWVMGGDRDPLKDEVLQRAMAEGIKESSPYQPLTCHSAGLNSGTEVFSVEQWPDFSMLCTYFREKQGVWTAHIPQVYEAAWKEMQKMPRKAFILGESQYEDENFGNALMMRRQAYWALLSGGSGHCYGSSVWSFAPNWREKLALPGASQMSLFYKIMNGLPWYLSRPDTTSQLLVEGRGAYGSDDYGVVSVLPNNRMAMIYLPSGRTIKVDVSKINGSNIRALWISPRTNNRFIGGYFKPQGIRELTPPSLDDDWLLLLGNVGRK
ncbi:apiosidase-like domain-containing protein [Runella slithyformis]|uniref:apiosidase-like domain-containing protein n=1 Tax=Runella slithyformis TaxID=106 RepID=UPI00030C0049|nr:DUF4038 domain-containing protein [Runella slithyformis]